MASIDLITGFGWGVDKDTITENIGNDQPEVSSAASTSDKTATVTFDRIMLFEGPHSVLNASLYRVTEQLTGDELPVLWVTQSNNSTVILHTAEQVAVAYDVEVQEVLDVYGSLIDPANNTASFAGTAPTLPTVTKMYAFFGLDSGMQTEEILDFLPDVAGPELSNQNPAPTDVGVDKDANVLFRLTDPEDALDLTSVLIYVEGALAYRGDTDTFLAPYNGGSSAKASVTNGYDFTIDKTSSYGSYATIIVRVVAADTALPTPNTIDVSYSFRIEDYTNPTIESNSPTGTGVSKTALIEFVTKDAGGSGVKLSSINVTVDGDDAITAGSFEPGWGGVGSAIVANGFNGYNVAIDKETDHPSYSTVSVSAGITDEESNPATLGWTFDVEDYEGPLVTPTSPTNGEVEVDIDENIVVKVEDDQSIDLSTLQVEVDPGTGFEVACMRMTPSSSPATPAAC
jgi:hypothetical protein